VSLPEVETEPFRLQVLELAEEAPALAARYLFAETALAEEAEEAERVLSQKAKPHPLPSELVGGLQEIRAEKPLFFPAVRLLAWAYEAAGQWPEASRLLLEFAPGTHDHVALPWVQDLWIRCETSPVAQAAKAAAAQEAARQAQLEAACLEQLTALGPYVTMLTLSGESLTVESLRALLPDPALLWCPAGEKTEAGTNYEFRGAPYHTPPEESVVFSCDRHPDVLRLYLDGHVEKKARDDKIRGSARNP
jgi:hypothetical protein